MFIIKIINTGKIIKSSIPHGQSVRQLVREICKLLSLNNTFILQQTSAKSNLLKFENARLDMQGMTSTRQYNYQIQISTHTASTVLINNQLTQAILQLKYPMVDSLKYLARSMCSAFMSSYDNNTIYELTL